VVLVNLVEESRGHHSRLPYGGGISRLRIELSSQFESSAALASAVWTVMLCHLLPSPSQSSKNDSCGVCGTVGLGKVALSNSRNTRGRRGVLSAPRREAVSFDFQKKFTVKNLVKTPRVFEPLALRNKPKSLQRTSKLR
jgi:hypothetical protein